MIIIKKTEIPQLSRSGRIYNTLTTVGGGSSTSTISGNIPTTDLSNYLQLSATTLQTMNNSIRMNRKGGFNKIWRNTSTTWVDYTSAGSTPSYESFIPLPTNTYKLYLGRFEQFNKMYFNLITLAVGQTFTFEYSKGAGVWGVLTGVTDNTVNFTVNNQTIEFTPPDDWVVDSVNGSDSYYYIRLGSSTSSSTDGNIIYCSTNNDNLFSIYSNDTDATPAFAVDKDSYLIINNQIKSNLNVEGNLQTTNYISSNGSYLRSYNTYLGTSKGLGVYLLNGSAATVSATVQNSPVIRFGGNAWNGTLNKANKMDIHLQPVSGSTTSSKLVFSTYFIDGNVVSNDLMYLYSNGDLEVINSLKINNLSSDTTDKVVYYNTTTKQLSYNDLVTNRLYLSGTTNNYLFLESPEQSNIYISSNIDAKVCVDYATESYTSYYSVVAQSATTANYANNAGYATTAGYANSTGYVATCGYSSESGSLKEVSTNSTVYASNPFDSEIWLTSSDDYTVCVNFASSSNYASNAGLLNSKSVSYYNTPYYNLTSGSTITVNCSLSNNFYLSTSLTGFTLQLTNSSDGQKGTILLNIVSASTSVTISNTPTAYKNGTFTGLSVGKKLIEWYAYSSYILYKITPFT